MSKQREYPFTAYMLTPVMHVKPVELARRSEWYSDYHETIDGRIYHDGQIHDTPQAAIESGRAKLAKQQANIEKRAANLDKAAAKL